MSANADAARLLAADEDVFCEHQFAYMLEADAMLIEPSPVPGRDPIQHFGRIECPSHISRPLLPFEQPLEQDAVDLVGIDKAAFLIDCANAIRIAISRKTGLAVVLQHRNLKCADMRRDRLRLNARKERVPLPANLHMVNA